jgi:hypothetical protein
MAGSSVYLGWKKKEPEKEEPKWGKKKDERNIQTEIIGSPGSYRATQFCQKF